MCFNQNQKEVISTQKGGPLKLVNKFTYLGSSVSSTENNINTRLAKICTATDMLSVIWKSDLSNKIKRNFFQAAVVSILLYECTTLTLTQCIEKKAWRQLPQNPANCIEQILEATSHKTAAVWPPTSHLSNHPSPTNKTCWTLQEK